MASQLGSVTVSVVPDEQSGEVGGLQNTGTQLGASIGTALAGAVLISALTASFLTGIQNNPRRPRPRRLAGADGARRRDPVHLRRRPRGRARGRERAAPDGRRDRRSRTSRAGSTACASPCRSSRSSRSSRCCSPEASRRCSPARNPSPARRRHSRPCYGAEAAASERRRFGSSGSARTPKLILARRHPDSSSTRRVIRTGRRRPARSGSSGLRLAVLGGEELERGLRLRLLLGGEVSPTTLEVGAGLDALLERLAGQALRRELEDPRPVRVAARARRRASCSKPGLDSSASARRSAPGS